MGSIYVYRSDAFVLQLKPRHLEFNWAEKKRLMDALRFGILSVKICAENVVMTSNSF
jgi:hypothetical protein